MNLVPDVTFALWGRGPETEPVKLGADIAYPSISEFIEVPVNMITMEPIFVLRPTDDPPAEGATFTDLVLNNERERLNVSIEVRELEEPGQDATLVVKPRDEEPDAVIQVGTLDEEDTARGEPDQANLHFSIHWDAFLPDFASPSVALVGEECLFDGSSAIQLAHSVPPGAIEFGVYDLQTITTCEGNEPLATFELEVAAGDNELVVLYVQDEELKMLHAPLTDL